MCIGVSSSRPSFLLSPPFNLQTVWAPSPPPPFRQSHLYFFFCELPLLKIGFFSEPQKYQSFSSLNPPYLLKVSKLLVKISQFEFLVMTEKNNFVYKLSFVIKYFRFQFIFLCKNCTPPPSPLLKKVMKENDHHRMTIFIVFKNLLLLRDKSAENKSRALQRNKDKINTR